jgi:hypothetical protein
MSKNTNKKKSTVKYYVLPVWGCVEPQPLIGPFKSYEAMTKRAVKVHAEQGEEDAIFWMRTGKGAPAVSTFTDDELDPDPSSE